MSDERFIELAKKFLTQKAETERKVKESAERIMLKIKNQLKKRKHKMLQSQQGYLLLNLCSKRKVKVTKLLVV